MKVVNIFGGPGSGKSTTAAGLFYHMKMAALKVELATEYAKDLVYAGQLSTMLEQQEYIFAEQNWRIQRLADHVDWVIVDSPILLSAVYPQMNQEQHGTRPWPALPQFIELVKAQFETYDNINIFLDRPAEYQQYGRERSHEEAKQIDVKIEEAFMSGPYPYRAFAARPQVVDDILEFLEQEHGMPAVYADVHKYGA